MIACPECGGNVVFDIASQKVRCEYCGNFYDPYSVEPLARTAEEQVPEGEYEVTVFTCPQCGGEMLSTSDSATAFCSFCGAEAMLESRMEHMKKPGYLIPFQQTKAMCKEAYAKRMKRAIFAPKELKDPKYIDGFRGIYMPYWAFHITQNGPVHMTASKSHRRGDYIITENFALTGQVDAAYKGISYDASSSFSDNISEALAPYDLKEMQDFTPAFLSGFYADTADVNPSVYQPKAEAMADENTTQMLKQVPAFQGYPIDGAKHNFGTKTQAVDSSLFPVWFLSYRRGNRVAYATVNGQTGKVVADTPVDPKKYLLGSLILAIPFAVLFALFLTLIPSRLMLLGAVLALLTSIIATFSLRSILRKDAGVDDAGQQYVKDVAEMKQQGADGADFAAQPQPAPAQKPQKKKEKKAGDSAFTGVIIVLIVIVALFAGIAYELGLFSNSAPALWVIVFLATLVFMIWGAKKSLAIEGHPGLLSQILAFVAVALTTVIKFINPVSDIFFYGGTIVLLAAVFYSIWEVIACHNLRMTRKLPQFAHEGGDNSAY